MFVNVSPSASGGIAGARMQSVGTGSEDLVQIYATADITDGYLMKGRLEAEGIPVLVKGEGEGPYRMGPVYLWVPGTLEVQARMIVESIEPSGAAPPADDEA